ncbi:MAG: hypothetical protein Q4B42_01280 [Oscillospiraceae bacterium]|nr:hypothetical protein [Oscillospiraceae bacterium]
MKAKLRHFIEEGFSERAAALICLGTLILSLVPMLLLTRFNYPSWDDFNWSAASRALLLEGKSILPQALASARSCFEEIYGNFIGFFNALMPDIFAESARENTYMWGSAVYILLFALICLLFVYTCLRRLLSASRAASLTSASLFTLTAMQFLPSGVEGFYNYLPTTSYTLPFMLQLLTASLAVSLLSRSEGSLKADKWRAAALFLTSAAAELFTYFVPGLTAVLVWVCLTFWLFLARSKGRWAALFGALGALCAFFATAFSGGAQGRVAEQAASSDPLRAIVYSLFFSGVYFGKWLCVPILILTGFIAAVLLPYIRSSAFSFKLPGLVSLIALGICCSVSTPLIYARDGRGSGRIFNMCFWVFLIALVFLAVYWLGWLERRGGLFLPKSLKTLKGALTALCCLVFLLSLAQFDRFDVFDAEQPMDVQQRVTSLSALWSLASGEAEAYAAEQTARREVLFDETVSEAVFEPIKTRPYLLFYRDLDYGAVAAYYGKESVTVTGGSD